MCTDQTLPKKLAGEGLARKFGDWWRDLALDHQAGGQEIHDFMADSSSVALAHQFINDRVRAYRASLPLTERGPWLTVTGGTFGSKDDIIKAVTDDGHQFSDWALDFIKTDGWTLLASSEEIDLYETTVKELTGKDVVTTTELYDTRNRLGFCDAPDETALLVRMAYKDQPMNEWRYILSQPKAGSDGSLTVLLVVLYSFGSFVYGFYAFPDLEWRGGYRLLLCRKRS